MKIHISMNDALLDEVDKAAQENYISRSGMISIACAQYIQTRTMSKGLARAGEALERIAESGQISETDKKELLEFSRQCQLYKDLY